MNENEREHALLHLREQGVGETYRMRHYTHIHSRLASSSAIDFNRLSALRAERSWIVSCQPSKSSFGITTTERASGPSTSNTWWVELAALMYWLTSLLKSADDTRVKFSVVTTLLLE